MTLIVNRVTAGDFLLNNVPVERGYLNGALFWERKLDLWVSRFLPAGQTDWWGYFNVDDHIQAIAPGFQGDVICHVDCRVISTNVEYPVDAGPNAPYRGYRSLTIRVEPNGRVFGFGGPGGAGGTSNINGGAPGGHQQPYYPEPMGGKVHNGALDMGSLGGGRGGDGGGCINGRGIAIVQMPGDWRNYVLAGGGGGGGSAKYVQAGGYGYKMICTDGGGGGGQGFNNPPGGPGKAWGTAGSASAVGIGGRGSGGSGTPPPPQPPNSGFGGYGARMGENSAASANGGNGGGWNQSGGGGGMALMLWTNWNWEGHFKGRDGNMAPSPTERGYAGAPGSRGSSHDYRRPWADGGWGGHSGIPVVSPRAIQYY